MVAGMEVDKVANKVAYMAPENRINWLTWNWTMSATMSNAMDMVADMEVDKVADKVADMFKTKCIKLEMF